MSKIINTIGLSDAWVSFAENDSYDKLGWRSITALNNPPQIVLLKERHDQDIKVDVKDIIDMLIGSAVHDALARSAGEDVIVEERFTYIFEGREISLKPDRIEPIHGVDPLTWHLRDFKITQTWAWIFDDNDNWIAQGNLYAYFLRKIEIPVTKITTEMYFKNWAEKDFMLAQAKGDRYPDFKIAKVPTRVWSDEECEKYLSERIAIHAAAENLPDEKLPPCSHKERWAKADKFAVVNPATKTNKGIPQHLMRASKNCNTRAEAEEYIGKSSVKSLIIDFRPGESKRCKTCAPRKFCRQYNEEILPKLKERSKHE